MSKDPTPVDPRLAEWERRSLPAILLAAIIPLITMTTGNHGRGAEGLVIEFASWLVFVVDFAVHLHFQRRYLHTRLGKFDLAVVILTSPWYLLPGVNGGAVVSLLRFVRLARVLMVGIKAPAVARTIRRLGRPFLYVTFAVFIAAEIVVRAEDHRHGFTTYGDGLWWAVVTITTVGYGDLVPESSVGRWTATVLMVVGVAMLGTVAASLASLFRLEDNADQASDEVAAPAARSLVSEVEHDITDELRALRGEVKALRERLEITGEPARPGPDQASS